MENKGGLTTVFQEGVAQERPTTLPYKCPSKRVVHESSRPHRYILRLLYLDISTLAIIINIVIIIVIIIIITITLCHLLRCFRATLS